MWPAWGRRLLTPALDARLNACKEGERKEKERDRWSTVIASRWGQGSLGPLIRERGRRDEVRGFLE